VQGPEFNPSIAREREREREKERENVIYMQYTRGCYFVFKN
jgi:hypothetical protein